MRKRVLGSKDALTLASTHALANCLYSDYKLADAEQLYRAALEGRQCVLGNNHQDTLTTRQRLAVCIGKCPTRALATIRLVL
jgi:hypothetical protein